MMHVHVNKSKKKKRVRESECVRVLVLVTCLWRVFLLVTVSEDIWRVTSSDFNFDGGGILWDGIRNDDMVPKAKSQKVGMQQCVCPVFTCIIFKTTLLVSQMSMLCESK